MMKEKAMGRLKEIIKSNGLDYYKVKDFCYYIRNKKEFMTGPAKRTFYTPWEK